MNNAWGRIKISFVFIFLSPELFSSIFKQPSDAKLYCKISTNFNSYFLLHVFIRTCHWCDNQQMYREIWKRHCGHEEMCYLPIFWYLFLNSKKNISLKSLYYKDLLLGILSVFLLFIFFFMYLWNGKKTFILGTLVP